MEKQLHVEDYSSELQEKLAKVLKLEKQLENVTSYKDAFEHIASELRKKLTAAELRYTVAEDQLNMQVAELQRISDLEKKIVQLSAQEVEMQSVPELQKEIPRVTAEIDGYKHVTSELRKKLNETEQRNILLEDKLTMQNVEWDQLVQASAKEHEVHERQQDSDKFQHLEDIIKEKMEVERINSFYILFIILIVLIYLIKIIIKLKQCYYLFFLKFKYKCKKN